MYRRIIFSLFTLVITSSSFACNCPYSEEFNLVDYDSYSHIFEVSIKSKYEFKKDSVNIDLPKNSTLYEIGALVGFNISILEVFKGDLNLSENIMGFPAFSSCSWGPEIGFTYIFYANSLNSIEACNRKLVKEDNQEYYENEKAILKSLKTNPKEFQIESNNELLIEGNFIDEKREGTWKIYSNQDPNTIALMLTYSKGKLLSVKKEKGYSETDEWLKATYQYYLEQVPPWNENSPTPKED